MKRNEIQWYRGFKLSALLMTGFTALLVGVSPKQAEAVNLGGSTHIGTFEGQTTFQTSSSNGINPGLYLEVMDRYGNYTEYISEDGVITVDGTKEGAYVTQAKFLGKTKYVDQETGEVLDQWEEGRDLKLESVKMPVLTTTGKNLFNPCVSEPYNMVSHSDMDGSLVGIIPVKPNTTYTLSVDKDVTKGRFVAKMSHSLLTEREAPGLTQSNVYNYLRDNYANGRIFEYTVIDGPLTFTTLPDCHYIYVNVDKGHGSVAKDEILVFDKMSLVESRIATPYEPFKSNILTTSEEVELRGIGDVRDELNLLTGELTQRVGKVVLDGSESWVQRGDILTNTIPFAISLKEASSRSPIICDKFRNIGSWTLDEEHIWLDNTTLQLHISKTKATNVSEFKTWLANNNVRLNFKVSQESIKTVDLTSTYTFGTVAMRDVYVDGKVKPLLCSVNVPTENLTFVLDPNQEEEKQFIAPTFRLINETPTSVRVSLTAFKQESNVFNDVSPTKYENWSQLNKEQSKDIALALVPLASDNWITVDETPRYVNNYSASVLGEIKAKSSVDLTFKALHGQAFTEELNPQYRLVFLFDF